MACFRKVRPSKVVMGKCDHGGDLLEEIASLCENEEIRLGRIEGIGAVAKARLGFYDQDLRKYLYHSFDKPLEIASLTGNISMREGKPFPHVHVTLSDEEGNAFGGHLAPGTIVFACEVVIQVFESPDFVREHDEETGLPLWKL